MAVTLGWTVIDGVFTINGLVSFSATGAIVAPSISTNGNGIAITGNGALFLGNNKLLAPAAATLGTGWGTSPSIVTNGTSCMTVNVGTGGTATNGVITFPYTATTGWIVMVENMTANAAHRADRCTVQTASTTTTATVESQVVSTGAATAWSASDILIIHAFSY